MLKALVFLVVFSLVPLSAQTITGSITGVVKDATGLAVAGAGVKLVQTGTGAERQSVTGERGDFVFSSVPPGEYAVVVTQSGFKTAERTRINLTASEVLPVGDIVLEVGTISDSITVTSQAATVQTASAERSGVVTSSQVSNLLIRNRTVTGLLQLLPGVVDQGSGESIQRNWDLSVNGGRINTVGVSLDGATLNALGNNRNAVIGVSQDAVAEVKVLLSNYQAEYGRMSNGSVVLVTKSGTRDFHGLGSYFKRHEQFNAGNFFDNRLSQPKARYRYNTWNYNVGGPIYIPGKLQP